MNYNQSINVLFQYSGISISSLSMNFHKFLNSTMNAEIGKKISNNYLCKFLTSKIKYDDFSGQTMIGNLNN